MTVYIGLGSNLAGKWGAPEQSLRRALAVFDDWPQLELLACSSFYVTPAMVLPQLAGGAPAPSYLNAVAAVRTCLAPLALLRRFKQMEQQAGRRRTLRIEPRWQSRALDLDILDYCGIIMHTYELVLPHPGMTGRRFVLEPLAEIAPYWHDPLSGRGIAALMKARPVLV